MKKHRLVFPFIATWILFSSVSSYPLQKASPGPLRPIETADIMAWKGVGAIAISPDGQWFAYTITSRDGFRELIIKKLKGKKEFRLATDASNPVFSEDSRWLAFAIRPDEKESRRLTRQNKKVYNKAGLVEVATGRKKEFDKIQRFSFSGEKSNWLALHAYPPETPDKAPKSPKGSTLFLVDLSNSKELSLGNVSEFGFDKSGRWLAWIVDAWEQSGNGLQVRNMETGQILSLDSDRAFYESLSWTEKGDGLCLLKGADDKESESRRYSVLGATGFAGGNPQMWRFEPRDAPAFPQDMRVSPVRKPRWTDDLDGFLFGIQAVKKKGAAAPGGEKTDPAEEEELPDLILWHWRDKRIPSQQQVEERADREFSYLCIYWVKEKTFVRLADDNLKQVSEAPRQHWAIGFDSAGYDYQNNLTQVVYQDIYAINTRTGEKRLAVKKHQVFSRPRWNTSFSPDGRLFLYYEDGHFFAYDMEAGRTVNITKGAPTTFANLENTYNVKDPPVEPLGWDQESRYALLSDGWDVWKAPVDGAPAVNLTVDGKKEGIRYQRIVQLDPEAKAVDLTGPVYFGIYGEWTKKAGYARLDKGRPGPRRLLWDDAVFYYLAKAKKADIYFYSRENFQSDNLYMADASLQNGVPLYDIDGLNQGFLLPSGVRLLDYMSTKGDKLQAALFLPADYEEGKTYPAIFEIYEKRSSWLNRNFGPGIGGLIPFYNSHGYAVLYPDILNRVDDPALSAVWCVLPAVEAAVAAGIVDRGRLGLTGHSMGGWETAFLITQTNLFKAAVAGAPLTNLTSMYGSIYGQTGGSNAPLFERSQARMSRGYWEIMDAYIRNSPVFLAYKTETPLLIMHNDQDNSVDWNQGVELFNVLRRLEKPVIMLQYKGEEHYLRKFPNRLDYHTRMKEFFDHYLLGKPAPRWLQEGVTLLDMEEHLRERVLKKEGNKERMR